MQNLKYHRSIDCGPESTYPVLDCPTYPVLECPTYPVLGCPTYPVLDCPTYPVLECPTYHVLGCPTYPVLDCPTYPVLDCPTYPVLNCPTYPVLDCPTYPVLNCPTYPTVLWWLQVSLLEERYEETRALLTESQEDNRHLRKKAKPSVIHQHYGTAPFYMPEGSLAMELEKSMHSEDEIPDGYTPKERR